MLEEGRISPALASAALDRHHSRGDRFEEALLECGLPESMLLRHLAEMFNTRFISTKTLSGASVPKPTLSRLPRRLAERYQVIPIRFSEDDTLTVVASEPANPQLLENVRVAAGARQVTSLVARPAAIAAAIAKLYGGDSEAFGRISPGDDGLASPPNVGSTPSGPSLASDESFQDVPLDTSAFDGQASDGQAFDGQASESQTFDRQAFDSQAFDGQPASARPMQSQQGSSQLGSSRDVAVQLGSSQLGSSQGGPLPLSYSAQPVSASGWVPNSDPPPELDEGTARARSAALGDASKLAESLMVIHERTRGSLKSHSVRVARLSYSLCRQLDLSEPQAAHAWATGLFHDLGKSQQHHLTALNVWQLEDHEVTARAQYKNPARLLKNADVPDTVLTAILHMYERFDGQGFPDGLSEEAIPFQSRVLALCDSVADLTLNPANTLGRIVSPLEACNHIRAQTPKVFDPTLLAHFSRLLVERKLDGAFLSDQSVHGIEKLLG